MKGLFRECIDYAVGLGVQIVLILIGSAVNIGFFRKNDYGLQIVRISCT